MAGPFRPYCPSQTDRRGYFEEYRFENREGICLPYAGMSGPFVRIDLHGLRQEEAIRVIDQAIASAGPATYQLQLVHGYHRGTSLRSMIQDWYRYDPKVKRIMPGDNPGMTVLVLKELY